MSSLPLAFPLAEDGPGRLTEVISFRKANKSQSEVCESVLVGCQNLTKYSA